MTCKICNQKTMKQRSICGFCRQVLKQTPNNSLDMVKKVSVHRREYQQAWMRQHKSVTVETPKAQGWQRFIPWMK